MLNLWDFLGGKIPTEVSFGMLVCFFFVCSAEATEIMRPLVFTILQESEVAVPDVFFVCFFPLWPKNTPVSLDVWCIKCHFDAVWEKKSMSCWGWVGYKSELSRITGITDDFFGDFLDIEKPQVLDRKAPRIHKNPTFQKPTGRLST